MKTTPTVLFVCTGNVARSPFMEFTLRQALLDTPAAGIRLHSAGTYAVAGSGVHEEVAAELAAREIDAEGFAAQQVTADLINEAGLILTAAREHRRHVARLAPRKRPVTFTLRQFIRLVQLDPIGEVRGHEGGPLTALAELANRNRGLSPGAQPEDDIADPIGGQHRAFATAFAAIDQPVSVLAELLAGLRGLPQTT